MQIAYQAKQSKVHKELKATKSTWNQSDNISTQVKVKSKWNQGQQSTQADKCAMHKVQGMWAKQPTKQID